VRHPAVLLDRDGTLNESPGRYVRSLADFRPIPGAFEAVGRLCRAGWRVSVITNQGGLALGLVEGEELDRIHGECARRAAEHGGAFDGFYVCPDDPDAPTDRRKPAPGMLLEAARDHGYDLARSYMIGDSERDLAAGRAAGAEPLLVLTGHGRDVLASGVHPADRAFPTLSEAVDWILARPGPPAAGAPGISVIVPAFDEETRLLPTLERLESWLGARGRSWEVIVVDDGSRDRTAAIAQGFAEDHSGFRLLRLGRNRGKGAAVREGFRRSRGELVVFSDADLSTPIEELERMLPELDADADFVLASRALPGSNVEIHQAWYRERMGKTFNAFVRLATGIPIRDTQCGFKLLRGVDARALAEEMREEGFAFDVELVLLARRRGLRLREFPVTWRNDAGSRVNPIRDSIRMLASLYRIVRRTGRYRV
jgi:dolichyl-phosphate beta-glucosyltransferase